MQVLFLIVLLGSCSMSTNKADHTLYTVIINQMQFHPSKLVVQKGDTVVFINKDLLVHNVTDEKNTSRSSPPLSTGKSYRMVFTTSSDYYCVFHPGMKGKIVVE